MRQLTHTSPFSVMTTIKMTFNGDNNADIFNGDNNADNDKMLSEQGGQLTLSAFSAMMTVTMTIKLTITKRCQNRQRGRSAYTVFILSDDDNDIQ